LRFPEFEGEWENKTISELCDNFKSGKTIKTEYISETGQYPVYGGNGLRGFTNNYNNDGEFVLIGRQGALCGNVRFAKGKCYTTEHAVVAKANKHNYTMFLLYLFDKMKLNQYSDQSAQPGLAVNKLMKLKTIVPSISEQIKIASLFSLIDGRIATQIKIIEDLKSLKSMIRHKLFKRLKKSCSEIKQIKNLIEYEQPTTYIVDTTDYSTDISLVPVLTANKAFILGYTDENFGIYDKGDCIIFDDFTMDLKYVDFPFKVKSSAMKILKSKQGINLKYIFEYLSFLNLISNEHKRHYISEVEPMYIPVPSDDIQNAISDFFSAIDQNSTIEFRYYNLLLTQKQYYLKQLFT
jgi:type I restriction enzyme S subunit